MSFLALKAIAKAKAICPKMFRPGNRAEVFI